MPEEKGMRLGDYVPEEMKEKPLGLDDLMGLDCMVMDWSYVDGELGRYAVMTIEMPDGEIVRASTGAGAVMAALENAEMAGDTMLPARFVKAGRAWLVE